MFCWSLINNVIAFNTIFKKIFFKFLNLHLGFYLDLDYKRKFLDTFNYNIIYVLKVNL